MQWIFKSDSEVNCNKKNYLLLQRIPIKQSKLVEVEIQWGSDLIACNVSAALPLITQLS